ncbi:transglutaminase family protein [Leptolyngbya sp. FACHB-261]|uniref:transglutaminase family protein n=1 Tax=Leptolyngbya sp. FACHB-261 TaxID=2692806 RepID=UPI001689280C|nr:transglutaminase family protein [Leptolyngbya sp. FACHB-261]MBD2104664.1 transglutaminase family protein [Leptolyngbya sp. FACHB-261]
MRYQIAHTTTYQYDQSVNLEPHILRLRPRCDGAQKLHDFALEIVPKPEGTAQILDLENNAVIQLWFGQPTDSLSLKVVSDVETLCTNPFNYLLEPWATQLPIVYPAPMLAHLQLYLGGQFPYGLDPVAVQLAQSLYQSTAGSTVAFLNQLNQQIHQTCQQQFRETGEPLPAAVTWNQRSGSCRDLAVLFMEVCRSMGLAARFVSGYQKTEPDLPKYHLHAWVEVYLPGAGWRGYDPSQGLAVADRHIPLATSAQPRNAAPVTGLVRASRAQAVMQYQLSIQTL